MTDAASSSEGDRRWRVRLTEEAAGAIDAQTAFLAARIGDANADRWQDALLQAIGTLARFPAREPLIAEAAQFQTPIRHLLYRQKRAAPVWRVLFTLQENEADGPTVVVLHVRHGAQGPLTEDEIQAINAGL